MAYSRNRDGRDYCIAPCSGNKFNNSQIKSFAVVSGLSMSVGFGTHTMRYTYRSWLEAVGTPVAVQQKLMRHADIRTTMNTYGDVVTNEMAQAGSKVAQLAPNGT